MLYAVFFASITLFGLDKKDETCIKGAIEHYVDAWNHQGGKGFGDAFSNNADFIDMHGRHFSGRKEIEQCHVYAIETFLKNSVLNVTNIKLREIQPGVVIALVSWTVEGFQKPGTSIKDKAQGIFSHTFIKNGDCWEIVASQNTLAND